MLTRLQHRLWLILAAICMLPASLAAGTGWNDSKTGNPVLPGYFADPCCRKFGDTYYLYVTPDGWGVGEGPAVIWTSKDFVHWTSNKSNWPTTRQKWAPSVVYRNTKYYMYTQVPCQVWLATADSPLGPWTNAMPGGGPMIPDQTPRGTITLDGECFIDTDGQAYIAYGTWWTPTIAKLSADLTSITAPIQYFENRNNPKALMGTVKGCMESPYILKRNGLYYYMYSNNFCQDSSYCVEYSTGPSPLGPFTYGANNPILETNVDGTVDGPGHHTILEDGGKTYIVYHRHDNPHHRDGAHRQIAIDELRFNPDGSIEKIAPTHCGVGFLAPTTVRDTNLACGKAATASSSAGTDFAPAYAADENNGTLWKAAAYTFPQWLQVDLGRSCAVKRVETDFQFPQVAYHYLIEYSTDGAAWSTFADRRSNTNSGSPMIDSAAGPITARYFRITITGDDSPHRPSPEIAIWNLRVYDGIDRPNQAPLVNAGPDRTGAISFPTLPISGVVNDDGLPNGPVKTTWSKQSGPGAVTFRNADRLDTLTTFGATGAYVLKLEADDGALKSSATVTYTINPPGDRIISYALDEPDGALVTDASGNAQNGVLKNGAKRGSGAVGGAAHFDGRDDHIAVPNLLSCNSLSIAAWIKPDTLANSGCILSGNGPAPGTPSFSIHSDGKILFSIAGCPDQTSDFQFATRNLGKWAHVAAIYDSAARTVTFFVNGKADATRSYSAAPGLVLTSGARIGGWDGGGRSFDGKIDELVVCSRTLSGAEVSALAAAGKFPRISDAKSLPDNQSITLKAKTVTYAPIGADLARATDFFYIQETETSASLIVKDGAGGPGAIEQESGATVTGVMRTSATTGERYLELTSLPEVESAPVVAPGPVNTESLHTSPNLLGVLVKVEGKVREIADNRSAMTISDGYKANGAEVLTTVKCESGPIGSELSTGNVVSVVGVVAKTDAAKRALLLREAQRLVPPLDPLTFGLQEYFRFDETSGTLAADSSGNGRNATLRRAVWAPGRLNNCVAFNGTRSYVSIPDMGTFRGITIAAWVNLAVLRDWQAILHCDGWSTNDVHLSFQGRGQLFFSVNGNVPVDVGSRPVFRESNLNTWKHIAVVYDAAAKNVKFYANGALLSQTNYATAVPAGLIGGIRLGCRDGGERWFSGKMDDFRLYGRALSGEEIGALYKAVSESGIEPRQAQEQKAR